MRHVMFILPYHARVWPNNPPDHRVNYRTSCQQPSIPPPCPSPQVLPITQQIVQVSLHPACCPTSCPKWNSQHHQTSNSIPKPPTLLNPLLPLSTPSLPTRTLLNDLPSLRRSQREASRREISLVRSQRQSSTCDVKHVLSPCRRN